MRLPPGLIRQITATWGSQAQDWLSRFPALLDEICARWRLELVEPFPNLSFHFVARVRRGNESLVLKMGIPEPDFAQEAAALHALAGHTSVELLDLDLSCAALLLEDVQPGQPLEALWSEDQDDLHTARLAQAMVELWRPPPETGFPTVSDWSRVLLDETATIPSALLWFAQETYAELSEDLMAPQCLLHGDLHHGNLLDAGLRWKAIDPKGVVGDAAFEVYALLRNPVGASGSQLMRLWPRRIAIVSEITGIPTDRLQRWGFVGMVISCCWSAQEGGSAPIGEIELARELGGIVV